MSKEIETGVELPESGIIDTNWAKEQLERVNIWSQELMSYGRGQVFNMLKISLSADGYKQSVEDLGYAVATAETYINYLELRPVLEAIKDKYFVAISLSASEYIPNDIEEALALCDIAIAKRYGLTADGLKKAAESTGALPKKMSNATITAEANKKKAFTAWLKDSHNMSDSDIMDAQHLKTEGKTEFNEKMIAAFERLGTWKIFYTIIAEPVHNSGSDKALRFLSDMNDAAASIEEFLQSEAAYNNFKELKNTFESTVYPEILYQENK